jgi:hypothetical protein
MKASCLTLLERFGVCTCVELSELLEFENAAALACREPADVDSEEIESMMSERLCLVLFDYVLAVHKNEEDLLSLVEATSLDSNREKRKSIFVAAENSSNETSSQHGHGAQSVFKQISLILSGKLTKIIKISFAKRM